MFEDQIPKNSAQTPSNLPVGEPADMFSEVDKTEPDQPDLTPVQEPAQEQPAQAPVAPPSSALGAGALRPVQNQTNIGESLNNNLGSDVGISGQNLSQDRDVAPRQDIYTIKEPTLTRGLVILIVVVVALAILIFGGWWIYYSFIKTAPDELDFAIPDVKVETIVSDNDLMTPPVEEIIPSGETTIEGSVSQNDISSDIIDDQILFGEPIDKDGDNLDDERELEIGTDPNNWDSDGDELSDGDEVIIWKTDPLNPDSDGDSYLDGAEVKNGYNPAGEGKLFEPPAEDIVVE